MSWNRIYADISRAVGEVASYNGDEIELFVYPEKFDRLVVGKLVLINCSGPVKVLGIVKELIHAPRHSSFSPLHMTRAEIEKAYPDLSEYHRFSSTIVYTSVLRGEKVSHTRIIVPRLHDLAFIVEDKDLLLRFFMPGGSLDLTFMRYYLKHVDTTTFRDFLITNHDVISKIISNDRNFSEFIKKITIELIKLGKSPEKYLSEISEILTRP